MNSYDPSLYRPDSRLETAPFPYSYLGMLAKLLIASNDSDAREVHKHQNAGTALMERIRAHREKAYPGGVPEPVWPAERNPVTLYRNAPLGLPQVILSSLHEWTYDLKWKANVLFEREMELLAEKHKLDKRYDVYLVWGVRVKEDQRDPITYRDEIGCLAQFEIEDQIIRAILRGRELPGKFEAACVCGAIIKLMKEGERIR